MTKARVSTLMVAGAVLIGFVMGSFPTGQVHAESTILSQLRVFSQILRHVKANYVEDVESEELVEAAIRGMLEELDPHSNYVEPEAFSRMNERNTGEYEGIGISFEMRDGWITVISAIEGGAVRPPGNPTRRPDHRDRGRVGKGTGQRGRRVQAQGTQGNRGADQGGAPRPR